MKKRLFSLLLALALLLGAVPVRAGAEGSPLIRCTDVTAQQQSYAHFSVEAEELQNLAALELTIYFDPQVLEFQYANAGWLLSSEIVSIHQGDGFVTLTAASIGGISGAGTLLELAFTVRADCPPGRYPLVPAVGEAYDTGRRPVSIAAKNGHITVTNYAPSYSEFRLGLEPDRTTLSPGEIVTITVKNEWYYSYASFDLSIHYDASMFRLVEVVLSEEFQRQNALCSLNTATEGLVHLTCACVNSLWEHNMLELRLEAKADAIGTTALTAEIRDVYDQSRFPYLPGSAQTELTVVPSQSIRHPQLRLEGETPVIGEETVSTLVLEEGSGLAAADFELRYDPQLLECLAVEPAADAQFLLINPNFADGTIRFSFVEEAGVTEGISLVNIRWQARSGADRHYSIESSLIDPVDAALKPVTVECPTQTGCIHVREVTEPTCETPGGEQLRCISCGRTVPVAPKNPLGHDYGDAEFHWSDDYTACTATRVCARDVGHVWQVNCTVTHVSTGESCTAPGSITYTAAADFYGEIFTDEQTVHRDMLGHDYSWTVLTDPGCTAEGLRRGECIRCGDTTTESIAPLGHDYLSQVTPPGCTEGGFSDHTCRRCGHSYRDSHTDPTGHSFEWFLMEAPDCTTEGWEQGKCTGCGEVQTRSVPALDHDWEGNSCLRCGQVRSNPFTDVPEGSFFYDPVLWAVKNGITSGTTPTTFDPNGSCMRAHVVTFLWRAVGQPEPSSTVNPFVDVKPSDFYYKAVLWAVENGVTAGMDATHFGPTAYCNRAQVVTFLYRTVGQPSVSSDSCPFTDVAKGAWYEKPILWAVENGITAGLTATTFGPNAICNRAQVVTFLYRSFS